MLRQELGQELSQNPSPPTAPPPAYRKRKQYREAVWHQLYYMLSDLGTSPGCLKPKDIDPDTSETESLVQGAETLRQTP